MSEGSPCPSPLSSKKAERPSEALFSCHTALREKKAPKPPTLLKLKISPCVKSGCLHFHILLRWVYPLCIIMHLCIMTQRAAEMAAHWQYVQKRWMVFVQKHIGNMHKNGCGFLCKIDSVKRFPLHPHGKSVAAIFERDETENEEV